MKTKSIRKRLIIIFVIILLFTVIPFILGVVIYNANFGGRIETAGALRYDISEFPGLEREQIDIQCQQVKNKAGLQSGFAGLMVFGFSEANIIMQKPT